MEKIKYTGKLRFIIHIDVKNLRSLPVIQDFFNNIALNGINVDVHVNMHPLNDSYEAHTKAINFLYKKIETPYYFHLEDDWEFLKYIDLDVLLKLMEKYTNIDQIRLSKETIKEKAWLYHLSEKISEEFLVPNVGVTIENVPLVQTPLWAFSPHLGRSSVVKNFMDIPSGWNPEKYICHKYPLLEKKGRIYIYGKIGESRYVQDLGINRVRVNIRKYKYILNGGKYADYLFDI